MEARKIYEGDADYLGQQTENDNLTGLNENPLKKNSLGLSDESKKKYDEFNEGLKNQIRLKQGALVGKLKVNEFYPMSEISKILDFFDGISTQKENLDGTPAEEEKGSIRYSDAFGDVHTFRLRGDQLKYSGKNLVIDSNPFKPLRNFEDKRMISSLLKFY